MYETKNIRLSLHLLKKTNIVGPSGPSERKHERKNYNNKNKRNISTTILNTVVGIKYNETAMEILRCRYTTVSP